MTYSFESRPDLTRIDVEVSDTLYRAWSVKKRSDKAWEKLIRDYAERIGRMPDEAEALKLLKKS